MLADLRASDSEMRSEVLQGFSLISLCSKSKTAIHVFSCFRELAQNVEQERAEKRAKVLKYRSRFDGPLSPHFKINQFLLKLIFIS